jgi:hypothetical protein
VFEIKINRIYLRTAASSYRVVIYTTVDCVVADLCILYVGTYIYTHTHTYIYIYFQRYLCRIKSERIKLTPTSISHVYAVYIYIYMIHTYTYIYIYWYKGGSALVTIKTSLRAYTSSPRTNLKWWSTTSRDIICVCVILLVLYIIKCAGVYYQGRTLATTRRTDDGAASSAVYNY